MIKKQVKSRWQRAVAVFSQLSGFAMIAVYMYWGIIKEQDVSVVFLLLASFLILGEKNFEKGVQTWLEFRK